MAGVFEDHQLGIPYQPIAELFAKYKARDSSKTAIVDLDDNSAIAFGELDQITTDIGVYLKGRGIRKGSRVLLLSDENLEKLLIWLGVWRIGAVICPFNTEINEKQMVALATALDPALVVYHKDIDVAAMVGNSPAPRIRFGAWTAAGTADAQDEFFAALPHNAGVPTVLNMLLNKPLGYTAKDIPTLRLMSCSTAPLTAQQWVQFEEMYGVKLLQLYGMSETGWVCGNRYYTRKMGTVGLQALHQELKIVDSDGNECPIDVEGEITVGGPQMAIGYLLDDGSIDPVRGKRIKTGDLGVKDSEGFIRVTGRTKDLIIRGGVNIAPQEIDEILLKHPGILDAAAIGVPDKIYGEEVVSTRPASGETRMDCRCLRKSPAGAGGRR